jgi:hypothetical protein
LSFGFPGGFGHPYSSLGAMILNLGEKIKVQIYYKYFSPPINEMACYI